MERRTCRVGLAAMAATLFTCWYHASAATETPLRVALRVYSYANISSGVRTEAAKTVAAIYAAAGIEIEWIDVCHQGKCLGGTSAAPAPVRAPLTVIIVADDRTPREHPDDVLGAAPSDSTVVYAYLSRIIKFSSERDLLQPAVLGHVIAHEVGHLLLQEGHAERGIMRARWLDADLLAMRVGRLHFTDTQSKKMRARLRQ